MATGGGLLTSIATAAVVLTLTASAAAQRTGFAIDRFEPSERGSRFFVVDDLDLRGHVRPALGAVLDYGYKPLVVYDKNGGERSAIVHHQMFVHLGGSLVLSDRVRIALNLPLAVYQAGDQSIVNGEVYAPSDKPAVGDVRAAVDLRLVGEKTDPFTLAVGVRAWAPTGPREQFAGDGAFRVAPQVLAAGDLGGVFTYGARVALVYRARDDAFAGSQLGSELVAAVGAGLKTLGGRLVVGPEVFASSVFTGASTFLQKRSSPIEGLVGTHFDITRDLRIGAGAGTGLSRGFGSPQFRGLFSFEWAPQLDKPDRDRDGIPDDVDACPDQAGPRDADPKKNGCPLPPPPPPPLDTDQDGIPDTEDACPTVPGPRSVNPKVNGCPDFDQDGVPDPVDACKDIPGVETDDPQTNGCPPDRDGDGILDPEDACPDVKGVRTSDPKTNGCPLDTDGDGILDVEDACPMQPGPKNADPKKNGCPLVIITDKAIQITEQVKFKTNSAELLEESTGILEAVRAALAEHPEIVKIRVEGHTDNVGNAGYNKGLSGRRAASVTKWLTDRGIDQKRLVSAGFGMEQPIDVNTTDAGRASNRRVAFTILEKDDTKKPAPAP